MPRSLALPPSGARSALHDLAAVRMEHLPAHVRGVVRNQEDVAVGHLARLAGPLRVRRLWPRLRAALDAGLPFLMSWWHGLTLRHAASSALEARLSRACPSRRRQLVCQARLPWPRAQQAHAPPSPCHALYNERTTPAYIESAAERHDREVNGMSGTAGAPNVATGQTARRCPLCGKPVTPDAPGFLECSCGWGGADDPLLTARGLTHWYRRLDRWLANAQARRDLARLARDGKAANHLSPIYLTVLFLISTLIYILFLAIIGLCAYLVVTSARDQDWIGVLLGGVLGAVFVLALWSTRGRPRGIGMAVSDLPHLAEALDEVRARVGAPLPQRIVLEPGTNFYAGTRHPPRRLFRRELVLGVGVGALPALSELEAKSILAHELAHLRGGGLALHKYVVVALGALRHVMDLALEGVIRRRVTPL
jgi:hypothetical protein